MVDMKQSIGNTCTVHISRCSYSAIGTLSVQHHADDTSVTTS